MPEVLEKKKEVKIGEYVLSGKIGQGGVAEIYKGRQESLDRDVAIKILSSRLTSDPEIVRRFERESLVIARLNHPNIVHVIDKGQASGRYYFVMSYIDGTSLRQVIDTDKVPLETKLEMIIQVCKALDYAHKNGVIHRDIKPSNVLIDRQGNALVADFGIAQIVGTPDSEMTSTDVIMGTMAYMSPEQKISSTNVDQTTDIYAVGIMLYEILCGRKPEGHFKQPTELNQQIHPAFDAIIQKCLAPDAKDRYATAVELKDAILNTLTTDKSLPERTDEYTINGTASDSFMGKCRYLDTIKETRYSSTLLVENRVNKTLYVIKKHSRGEHGRKEAKILSKLKHAHIIDILGSGGSTKNTVIISEYAQGGSLGDRMARKHEWKKAFEIVTALLTGLDHAHKNNVTHGNIRPSNILFDSKDTPKLADFGMPAHYDPHQKKNWYNPPEHKISKIGDIYALGVILHQMITGRNPSYDNGGNLRLDDIKMELPEGIRLIISKLLAIRVARRYQSCEEVLLAYDEFISNYYEPKPRQTAPQADNTAVEKSNPATVYFIAGAALIVTVILTLYFSGFFK